MSRRAPALLVLVLALAAPATVLASWDHGGGGSAYTKARSLPGGEQPATTVSNRDVSVSWPAAGGGAVTGYIVKRYDGGSNPQTVGASCSGTIAATGCTESAVSPGTWRYTVTPANGNWRGAESPLSTAVTVAAPALTLGPSSVASLPATLSGQVANFIAGQTLSFRLDNQTSGTVLSATVTPSPVPASGTSDVDVTLPAGTSPGPHTIFAIGDQGDVASTSVTVLNPQTAATTAWDLRDASAGGAEVNASDPIAFASDGRTITTTAPLLLFSPSRYLLVDYNSPLPTNATPSASTFDFRFAAASGLNTACFYFDVRRASTDAVLATHGSAASPVGCVSSTAQTSFSTALPEVSTRAIANDLRVQVYIRDSLLAGPAVDQATITTTTTQGAFTLHDQVFTDHVNGLSNNRTWPLVASGGNTYTSDSAWSSAFAAGRYLRLTFPSYLPTAATMTGASFTHRYRASGAGTVCWYFEVLQGSTVIGTHGSAAAPINCNASTSTYQEDTVSVPEINTPARANQAVIKIYMRNSSSQRSQTDWAQLQLDYAN